MPDPTEAIIAQNVANLNALIDALGLRLLDPTLPTEAQRFGAERVQHLAEYVLQRLPEEQ